MADIGRPLRTIDIPERPHVPVPDFVPQTTPAPQPAPAPAPAPEPVPAGAGRS